MQRGGCVYILSNKNNTVVYVGVTSNIYQRVWKHKNGHYPDSFSAKYNCNKLVYYEFFPTITEAIKREKQIKKWNREWKNQLIAQENPNWLDLFNEDL